MANSYVGEIRPCGFNFAPYGWAFCDGSLLSIAEFEVLYNLIGTTYGGDGVNTFQLPDLRGRVPIGTGQGLGLSEYVIGQIGGVETVTLSVNQIPSHSHTPAGSSAHASSYSPSGHVSAVSARDVYATVPPDVKMAPLANTGGSQPHENRQPYLTTNFVISLFGVFPSRN